MQMLISSIRASFLDISTKLNTKFSKLLDKLFAIILIGNVTISLVLVKRLGVVKLMIGLIGVFVFRSIRQRIERCHHTDTTNLVFRVHIIAFVAKRSEVHTSRSAKTINQSYNLLAFGVGILDSKSIIVLCPSRTSRSVDNENVTTTKRMIGCSHHHVTMVY